MATIRYIVNNIEVRRATDKYLLNCGDVDALHDVTS